MAGRKPTVSDDVILRQFALSSDPFLTTRELADAHDITVQGMGSRLSELVEDGYLNSKSAGNAHVYWLTERGRKRVENEWID